MATQTQEALDVDIARSALIMIEFQREWLDADGRLNAMMEDRPQFEAAIAGGRNVLNVAREAGVLVAHAGYSFSPGYPELGTPDYGMDAAIIQYGTFVGRGAEFATDFEPKTGELTVSGRTGVSAFAGSNLDSTLRRRGIDTLFLAGFSLSACVESTARHAKDLGYRVYVVEDATAAFSEAQRSYVLDQVLWMFAKRTTSGALFGALNRHLAPA
jgi:nicotinamidase-related amidase